MRKPTEADESADSEIRGQQPGWATLFHHVAERSNRWARSLFHSSSSRRSELPFELPQERLESLFAQLQEQRHGLTSLGQHIESQFLKISADLEKLPAESDALVAHSEKMLRLAAGSERGEPTLERTLALLRAPLDYVNEYQTTTCQLLGVLRERAAQVERMLSSEQELQRTVAPLKFIRTMYRVESAMLSPEVQGMFLALTEEIQSLQQQVNETFAAKFDILRSNQTTIRNLIKSLDNRLSEQGVQMKQKRSYIAQAVQDLKADLEANRQHDIKLTKVTQGISLQVGKLVFGLQAQDVIGQKISHVLSAFGNMEEKLNEALSPSSADDQRSSVLYLSQASGVEAAQLRAVADNLRETDDALCGALDQILEQVKGIDLDCVSLTEFDQITTSASGLVQTLLDSLSEVQTMVDGAVSSAKEAFDAIRPMGGQASNVTGTMRELSARIKLIALNAQVQAAQIDSGTGLEVLAAQTADIATTIGKISGGIAEELDAFTKHLDQLVGTFGELHEKGTSGQQTWRGEFLGQEKELHLYRDETLSELGLIGETANRLRQLAKNMRANVELKALADGRVELPSATLDEIHELLDPHVSQVPEHDTKVAYTRSYTMESERQVHENALAGNKGSADRSAPAPATASGDISRQSLVGTTEPSGELLLFDDFSGPSTPTPAAGASSAIEPALASAPSPQSPAPQPDSTPSPAPKPMGDNVELF